MWLSGELLLQGLPRLLPSSKRRRRSNFFKRDIQVEVRETGKV